MFTPAQTNTIARRAHHAVEGDGSGHTVYDNTVTRRRYVVGGYAPSLLFPAGESVPFMRDRIAAMVDASPYAETLGYWENDGTVHVDLGAMYHDLDIALTVARERGELAIYDRSTGECITVRDLECDVCHARALTADSVSHDTFCPGAAFPHHVQ